MRRLTTSQLHQSPFRILGATTRDNRRHIVELAEHKSLEIDHDSCQKARGDITNPRTRLSAEMAWLPGVSPRRATQCLQFLLDNPIAIREETGLPTLAKLNLLSSVFEAFEESYGAEGLFEKNYDAEDLVEFIIDFAHLVDDLDANEIMRDINEDRVVSGFPEIQSLLQIEKELGERRRCYRDTVKDCLNRFSSKKLIQIMTDILEATTHGGEKHAPSLVNDLVDSYESETQAALEVEAENIRKLLAATEAAASSGESAVKPIVEKLVIVARNWDDIAQPIQLSNQARGIDHNPSTEVASEIRNLAVNLNNEHGMLEQAQRLTNLSQELFKELPEMSERLDNDAGALANIAEARAQAEKNKAQWERDIAYQADIGIFFKKKLRISSSGIFWEGRNYPLETITRVRWGGVRHSTGIGFTVAFGDDNSEAVVQLSNEGMFNVFVGKLWRAVGIRLISEMLKALKYGEFLHFDRVAVHDKGILLEKHRLIRENEFIDCSWSRVHVWTADGAFCIGARDEEKIYSKISYIDVANTHLLEQIIRMKLKKAGDRLSDLVK